MLTILHDPATLAYLTLGAFAAGIITGFAGFGTGLVASGLWFHVLPAHFVPPLIAMASVAAQMVSLVGLKPRFDWPRAAPFLIGGVVGVPIGVTALSLATPGLLRLCVGGFLVLYSASQLVGLARFSIGAWGGRPSDAAVGIGGGFLGGFAGLSGPLPLVWLQLRGGPSVEQRAVYQPFNIIVLAMATAGMATAGQIDGEIMQAMLAAVPATIAGAWLGSRFYRRVSEAGFRRVVLALLLASGAILVGQSLW